MALFILAMPLKGRPDGPTAAWSRIPCPADLELALLIKTGQAIGFWATLGLVVGAAVLGAAIMSRQGISVARRTREAVATGPAARWTGARRRIPAPGRCLLISPGFITDVMALALLIPPIRRKVARWCVRRLAERAHAQAKMYEARRRAEGGPSGAAPAAEGQVDGPIIEGEFERLGEKGRAPHPGKDRDRI